MAVRTRIASLAVLGATLMTSAVGSAAPIVFSATGASRVGTALAASAEFDVLANGDLQLTLTNWSLDDARHRSDVLTGLFFDGGGSLTPVSASLSAGSVVRFGPSGDGNVGGEWAYADGSGPGGTTRGLGASALGGFFGAANFGGPNLQGPRNGQVASIDYGLTSAGDDPATGGPLVTGRTVRPRALIQDSVTFILATTPDFSLASISTVIFQYGAGIRGPELLGHTNAEEGVVLTFDAPLDGPTPQDPVPTVPEPGTLSLFGLGLIFAAHGLRRASKR